MLPFIKTFVMIFLVFIPSLRYLKFINKISFKYFYKRYFNVAEENMPPRRLDFTPMQLYKLAINQFKFHDNEELLERFVDAKVVRNILESLKNIVISLITGFTVSFLFGALFGELLFAEMGIAYIAIVSSLYILSTFLFIIYTRSDFIEVILMSLESLMGNRNLK